MSEEFGMITDVRPMSAYERQALLNKSVRSPSDFSCTDEEYFDGNARTARLRPPNPGTRDKTITGIVLLDMHPMVIVVRKPVTAKPQAVAVLALNDIEREQVLADLPRMGDDSILNLAKGDPTTLHKPRYRWFLLS